MHAGREEIQELLGANTRFTVPLVDDNDQTTPNTILLFEKPIRLTHVRRGLRTGASVTWVKRAESGQEARGLLLRTSDSERLANAFRELGLRDRLTREDADFLAPTKADIKRLRRLRWLSIALTAYAILVVGRWIFETFFD